MTNPSGHEQDRQPRVEGASDPRLEGVLARPYMGFTESTVPAGGFVLPATLALPVVVKIRDSPLRPPTFVGGPQGEFRVIEGSCAPEYLEVWLAPLGAYRLLNAPIGDIAGQIVDLSDVMGSEGRRLGERVREAGTWQTRFEVVDRFLLERLGRGREPSPEVEWAWAQLKRAHGLCSIGALAEETSWSHKHLITKFKQQVGLTPKRTARLLRFNNVRRRGSADQRAQWARIAAEAGYADQSHLIRDFRQFAGTTPASTAW